ncbi:MAG: hypothetical protein GY859_41090 [Desulfobacterales bacterium]|nr:hypothetical protein [Desulfobacterales bacterium]
MDPEILRDRIVDKVLALGASIAGVVDFTALRESPTYAIMGYELTRPPWASSILVIGLAHDESSPELDWWDRRKGGTPGNRKLMEIARSLADWARDELDIYARLLPYHPSQGGIFLKGAVALAGLGVIGANNLLITPRYGPRVRLRALFLDAELASTPSIHFSPCESCPMPCRKACPQNAFTFDAYNRDFCLKQMAMDEAVSASAGRFLPYLPSPHVKYCRACELACPVGRVPKG